MYFDASPLHPPSEGLKWELPVATVRGGGDSEEQRAGERLETCLGQSLHQPDRRLLVRQMEEAVSDLPNRLFHESSCIPYSCGK
jgi:hypothetical protein